jgi:hypothetical protein
MNLNKYTKAELISKYKNLINNSKVTNSKDNNNNSILNNIRLYFSQLLDMILLFKNILIKLTLISFLIQIFRKHRMIEKI